MKPIFALLCFVIVILESKGFKYPLQLWITSKPIRKIVLEKQRDQWQQELMKFNPIMISELLSKLNENDLLDKETQEKLRLGKIMGNQLLWVTRLKILFSADREHQCFHT